MATIASTLKILDGFSAPIQKNIGIMNRMVDVMEEMNRAGDMPGLENTFHEIRADISLANHDLDVFNEKMQQSGNEGERATARVSVGFGGIERAIIVANQALGLLKAGYSKLTDIMGDADTRNSADARLNLIRDELRTQEELEAQILATANATRTSYDSTASLVATMGRQEFFEGNNDKAIAFAKTLGQTFTISGASASETNSIITQMSQALASGVLRGDEFNSMMENGPVLAEMMAASLGVTKGELREMAMEGQLTTDVVVASIMQQADTINEQFGAMPMTFGQISTIMGNHWSQMLNNMSQEGMPLNNVIVKMEELNAWLQTLDGQNFMAGIAAGFGTVINAALEFASIIGSIYGFFTDNWVTIEPILIGLGIIIGGVTAAIMAYNAVIAISEALELASATAKAIQTGATIAKTNADAAATAAQWGLNAAMLANPTTWVVLGIIALIAIIVALSIWLYKLWQTNVDFKVGVMQVWNSILGFFDQVPIFFMGIGYGIADAFSHAKVWVATTLEDMANGAIDIINGLIEELNMIPGVSIDVIDHFTGAAETAAKEEAARQSRATKLQESKDDAAAKSAEREQQLAADAEVWREEAAQKEADLAQKEKELKEKQEDPFGDTTPDFGPVEVGGGELDKVGKIGKEIDLSDQSLEYLRDIAEMEALDDINSYNTVSYSGYNTVDYNSMDEARLNSKDADLLKTSSKHQTNIYYLQYSGGDTNMNNNIQQGDNWEDIKRKAKEETEAELEIGLNGLYEEVGGY